MQIGPDTTSVLEYLDSSVEGGLRKRNDIGVLLELGAQNSLGDTFNSIVTTGTGLWKVYGILKRLKPGAEGYSTIEIEFGNLLNEIRELLAEVINDSEDEIVQRYDDIYFGMTQGVIRNLVDLAHDLAAIKNLQRND
ncbi:MAG: hypothetical protein HQ472_10210 [Ignavibacteria bacterium]|nr:hypothetical protein [Ignavibacteria bacterium]